MQWFNRLAPALRPAAIFLGRLWWWTQSLARPRKIKIVRTDEEPTTLKPHVLYVIEDSGHEWAAVMGCPGGCGQTLHMNLLPDSKPVWRLTEHSDGAVSLSPSIWRREGCGCHFWLKNGCVEWC